jgi:WD40 repeat protein
MLLASAAALYPSTAQRALAQDPKPRAILKQEGGLGGSDARSLQFSEDGKTLVSGYFSGYLHLWDLATNKKRATLKSPILGDGFRTVEAITPDGKTVVWGWDNGKGDALVVLWDVVASEERVRFKEKEVRNVAITRDGKTLAWATREAIKLWDVAAGKEQAPLKNSVRDLPLGPLRGANPLVFRFTADGKTLAANFGFGIRLWDVVKGKELATLSGHTGYLYPDCVALSTDGKLLASGSEDKTVKLWDPTTHKELATLKGHPGGVHSVALTADGKLLASGGYVPDKDPFKASTGFVTLWDVGTQKPKATLKLPKAVNTVALTADGKTLAVSGLPEITLWDVAQVLAQQAEK